MKTSQSTSIQTTQPEHLQPSSKGSGRRGTKADSKGLKALEVAAGGRDGLSRLLLFLPAPSEPEERLLELLEAGDDRPLIALLREVGLSPALLASAVAKSKLEFEREIAKAEAVAAAPEIIADLRRHAVDRMGRCPNLCTRIDGMGPKTFVQLGTDKQVCPLCEGRGETLQSSPHKQWAAGLTLKIGNLPEDRSAPLVAIQQNVGVGGGSPDFMERMVKAAHAVVGRPEVVDAEIVKVEEPVSTPQES